jgi:hypothetical protein
MQINTQGTPRRLWERPTLRRLAADKAQGGVLPCNDGGGQGCGGSGGNHSLGI